MQNVFLYFIQNKNGQFLARLLTFNSNLGLNRLICPNGYLSY